MVVKRRYESTHRQDQARQTRLAVLAAARTLFVASGYGPTTLAASAQEAGVAVQTVYKIFGNKKTLLSELVDLTIAGDDEPIELAVIGAADVAQLVGILGGHGKPVLPHGRSSALVVRE